MGAVATIASKPEPTAAPERQPSQYREEIPIQDIRESKTNPRRNFTAAAMADLTLSIRQLGVLEPLIVRPDKTSPSRFELVSGARRYRAAKMAGLETVPCRIFSLTDQEVLEIHVVENLQREDLHPLEEAKGYRALMAAPHRRKAAQVAEKISKSEKYVYDRVKLLDLIPELQEVFWAYEGGFSAGHAVILARIPADKQKACNDAEVGGLWQIEHTLYDPEDEDYRDGQTRKVISVRELQAWVDEHVRFETKPDPMLYPETAKALEQAEQADEKVLPITYEHVVDDSVRDGSRIFGPRSWVRADGQHDSKTCEHSEPGLVISGPRRGEAFRVCRAKKTCLVHYGKEIRARLKAEKAKASGEATERDKAAKREQQRQAREAAERAREEQTRETWEKATPKILDAVAERVKTMPTKASGFLAQVLLKEIRDRCWGKHDQRVSIGTSAEDVVRYLAYITLAEDVRNSWRGPKDFPKVAKALGIDIATILKAHAPKPQTSAEPAKKGKK